MFSDALLFDDACGTGGILTVGEDTLQEIAKKRGLKVSIRLYGQEINPETYAICKADMLLKGEGENAKHIVGGAEWSTLSHDAFPSQVFDLQYSGPLPGYFKLFFRLNISLKNKMKYLS